MALFRCTGAGSESFTYTSSDSHGSPVAWDYYYPHFNDEEAEDQRGQVRSPQSHSQKVVAGIPARPSRAPHQEAREASLSALV